MLFLNKLCTKTLDVIILYELFLKHLPILYLITLVLHITFVKQYCIQMS